MKSEQIFCPKCKGTDISEGARLPKVEPDMVSLDDLAKRRKNPHLWDLLPRHAEHFARCKGCGYEVTWMQ